jgi:hypothetical protein
MARIPLLTNKEDVAEDKQHIVEEIMGSRGGRISGPFSVLLHNPEAAGRSAHLGSALRFESTLPDALREVAINTAARVVWSCKAGAVPRCDAGDIGCDCKPAAAGFHF